MDEPRLSNNRVVMYQVVELLSGVQSRNWVRVGALLVIFYEKVVGVGSAR